MAIVIVVANQKGGVGKTTTAVSLAHGLALKGKEVLLIDLDPQGQAAVSLGLKAEPGAYYFLTPPPGGIVGVTQWVRKAREHLWLIPGDSSTNASQAQINAQGKRMNYIAEQIALLGKNNLHLDYILFDTAPSVGGIQERSIWASDLVLIPAATEFLSADSVRKVYESMGRLRQEHDWNGRVLGILPTFFDDQTRESRIQLEEYRNTFKELVLLPIHRATILRECPGEGRTIFEMGGTTEPSQRALQEYQALADHVVKMR